MDQTLALTWNSVSKEYIKYVNELVLTVIESSKSTKLSEVKKTMILSLAMFLLKESFTHFNDEGENMKESEFIKDNPIEEIKKMEKSYLGQLKSRTELFLYSFLNNKSLPQREKEIENSMNRLLNNTPGLE